MLLYDFIVFGIKMDIDLEKIFVNVFGSEEKTIQRCANGGCSAHATSKYLGVFYCPLHIGQIPAKENTKDQEVRKFGQPTEK